VQEAPVSLGRKTLLAHERHIRCSDRIGIGGEDELEKGDAAAAPAANSSSKAMSNDLMKGDDLEKSDDLK